MIKHTRSPRPMRSAPSRPTPRTASAPVSPAPAADTLTGTIAFTRSGSAFVDVATPRRSFFVPAANTGTAMHGDTVSIRPSPKRESSRPGTLTEATVVAVINRRQLTVVGTLQRQNGQFLVLPMQAVVPQDIVVPDSCGATPGDRVLVRLAPWTDANRPPTGDIVEVIGPADNPAFDTLSVLRAYDLADEFPAEVMREAAAAAITPAALKGRVDLRGDAIFTIDPETARDYDDAISLAPLPGKRWRLGVHIADVAHFVTTGSALDAEASKRGTSVYLPDKVVPMLPEQLSNGLCSLHPDVDRLCFSAIVTLSDAAEVLEVEFAETVIRSQHRLTYAQALAVLESRPLPGGLTLPASLVKTLKSVHKLAQKLRAKRVDDGALMLVGSEVKFDIAPDGRIRGVIPQKDDVSHQLIEECMLLANELVSKHLYDHGCGQLYRIHAEPDPEALNELTTMFTAAGLPPLDLSDRKQLAECLSRIQGMPAARAWNTSVLRSMKKAEYSIEPLGHYGLAKDYYAHFTSPIRRYPDLVIHRVLKACLRSRRPPYSRQALAELALTSSQREQVAAEAERACVQLKLIRFFKEQLDAGKPQPYEAVVVDVRNIGVFVDIPAVQTGGLIRFQDLGNDFFELEEGKGRVRGRRTGATLELGSTLEVMVSKVDEARKRLDFAPTHSLTDGAHTPGGGKRHGKTFGRHQPVPKQPHGKHGSKKVAPPRHQSPQRRRQRKG